MNKPIFTIFTPCYNGEKTIHRVFASVEAQTMKDFEWIIINDGSTDNSEVVIRDRIAQSPVKDKIIFISQENKGKHISWNKAVRMAQGEWFLSADCDDSFVPNTLAFFLEKTCDVKEKVSEVGVSGINVCCYNPDTREIIGTPYPKNRLVSNNIELAYKYNIIGEHWGCVNTILLKSIEFPVIKGHFYNESYLWFSFAKNGYKVVCYNEPLRAYHIVQTSLCHNKSYKFDKDKIFMELHFTIWQICNVGDLIFKYSKIGFF